MAIRLSNLCINKIHFVDAGDNKGAHVVIAKRREAQKVARTFEEILAGLPEEDRAVMEGKLAGMQPPAQPVTNAAPAAPAAPAQPVVNAAPVVPADDEEATQKAREKAERVAMAKRIADLEEKLEIETFAKRTNPLNGDLAYLPGIDADSARLFKRVRDNIDAADWTKLDGIFKSASEAIRKGSLFKGQGTSGSSVIAGSAEDRLNGIAEGMRKQDPKLSVAKSRKMAAEQNPDIYAEYVADRERGRE